MYLTTIITILLFLNSIGSDWHQLHHQDIYSGVKAAAAVPTSYSPCPRAFKINTNNQFRGSLHFICLQANPNSARPLLEVIQYQTGSRVLSREVDELGTNQLASFVDDEGTLRILVAVPHRINGTSMYSIDRTGVFFEKTHTINTQFVSAMSVWKLELNWEWQLAFANQPSYEMLINDPITRIPLPDPRPIVTIQSWRSSYFDSYQRIQLPQDGHVNKLEPMNVNGQDFLIVAMEANNRPHQANEDVESLIYRLDFGDGNLNWLHYQTLPTKLALDVRAFKMTHKGSLRREYYIALLGQSTVKLRHHHNYNNNNQPTREQRTISYNNERQLNYSYPSTQVDQDDYEQTNGQYGLIIYKYFGDQFMETNSIAVQGATKLDTISYGQGDSYVIIALLSGWSNQISLYLFDGLSLKSIPSPSLGSANTASMNMQQPRQLFPPRPRRTMADLANVHLFLVPQQQQQQQQVADDKPSLMFNETSGGSNPVKRTWSDEMQTLTMPALAFSGQPETFDEKASASITTDASSMQNSSSESFYQIPINEIIKQQQQLEPMSLVAPTTTSNEQADETNLGGPTKRNYIKVPPPIGSVPQQQQQRQDSPYGQDLLNWCQATIGSLLNDNFDSLGKQLLSLPRVDQLRPIELLGDLIIEDDLHVSNLLYVNHIKEIQGPTQVIIESPPANFSDTFDKIQQTHREIDFIKQRVDQILVDDGSNQDIFNPMTFETLIIECPSPMMMRQPDPRFQNLPFLNLGQNLACPRIDELRTIRLNSHDISDIQRQALLTGRTMNIARDVRFEHLVLYGSVEILDSLNGIPIQEIVFKRGPTNGPIKGHKNFQGGLYSSTHLSIDAWNDVPGVDGQNYFTSSGAQRIEADLRFSQIIIDPSIELQRIHNISSRFERLNGQNLDLHLGQIALANSDNSFDIPVHFDELILNGPVQFTANSRLSLIDIENQWLNTMFKHANQNVTAPMEFSGDVHVSFGGDILVDGQINGVLLNQNNVLMRNHNGQTVLPNPILFEQDVSIRDLQLGLALNGIQVVANIATKQNELAILYDGFPQLLTGDKVLTNVHLGGRSTITGNINGNLDLTQLYNMANNNGEPYRFERITLSGNNIRFVDRAHIHIDSTINGISTNDICNLANRIAQSTHINYNRLKFEQPVYFKSLHCLSINGFNNLTNYFLTKHGNQVVSGPLRLTNGVIFNTTVNIRNSLNEFDIRPLSMAIAKTINETRTGHKNLFGDLIVDELIAERVNNLRLSNVLLARADAPQIVRAKMTFDHLDIENVLTVGQNLVTNSFNGLNITDIVHNTLQYDTPQIIYDHVELNTLQLLGNSNFLTKDLNGYDLQRVYADSVLIDLPQQILAPTTFRAPVEFGERVYLRHGIDGLTSEELRFNLLLHSDELIEGDLEFNDDIMVKKELDIQSGIINDIDLNTFVDSMLYENRPDRKGGMRIIGNGSVRFKDVQVNNLVVAGTIQGVDVSKEALLRNESLGNEFNAKLKQLQWQQNNQRLLNLAQYGTNSIFRVGSNYRGVNYIGTCQVHSCPQTTLAAATAVGVPMFMATTTTTTLPSPSPLHSTVAQQPQQHFVYPNILPKPSNLIITGGGQPKWMPNSQPRWMPNFQSNWATPNVTTTTHYHHHQQQWAPNWTPVPAPAASNVSTPWPPRQQESSIQLVDPGYLEYKAMMQAQAIRDLAFRINKLLSVSFYYEIVQKHPLLGPLLHSAKNPILNEQSNALLLLKGTSKPGEPCLQRGQTIAVMARQRARNGVLFTQSSRIQETSNPKIVDSVVAGGQTHYLFILDSYPESSGGGYELVSQVIIYVWDYRSGMYELKERIVIDGVPTAMKAFTVNNIACVALANPKVMQGNLSGPPLLYCQQTPLSSFNLRTIIPVANVFDLDIMTTRFNSTRVIVATLSQQNTEQIGDLNVNIFDIQLRSIVESLALRRMIRPMKLHLFRNFDFIQLAISEAITTNDNTHAITRIFSIDGMDRGFYESQILKDNQFYDIQSVKFDNRRSLLFFQSAHSISIYAPSQECPTQYILVQRLPTKGANKFLVVEDAAHGGGGGLSEPPFGHLIVLSKEDCERQQWATLILKANFNHQVQKHHHHQQQQQQSKLVTATAPIH